MGLYAITGSASGIGAAIKTRLVSEGHDVIGIDVAEADVQADLATADGRQTALDALRERAPDGLDGFVPSAGVGPDRSKELITRLNYFGALTTSLGALEMLEKRGGALVAIASNSVSMPADNDELVKLLLADDEDAAVTCAEAMELGQYVYSGTKIALTRWMRGNSAEWARRGVRINVVAPGMTMTPLVEVTLSNPKLKALMEQHRDSIPLKRTAEPEEIAAVIRFLLGADASFCCGSLLFIDGGFDAQTRPEAV